MKQLQRGQALLETLLCIPLFMLILVSAIEIGHIYMAKMELAAICRETAIHRSRMHYPRHGNGDKISLNAARYLAQQSGRLDPLKLSIEIKAGLALPHQALNQIPLGAQAVHLANAFSSEMFGEKITLRYTTNARGLKGILFPRGFVLEESLLIKSGDWNNPGEKLIKKLSAWKDLL